MHTHLLRWLGLAAGVAALVAPLRAGAQVHGSLAFGLHFELQDCFEGDHDACERAGLGIGNLAWESVLLEEDRSAQLGPLDTVVYHGIQCARWEGDSCAALGDLYQADGDRYRAAMLHAEACVQGHEPSCELFTARPSALGREGFDEFLAELSMDEIATHKLEAGVPPTAKQLGQLARSCDAKKGTLDSCLTLARAYNSVREEPAQRAAASQQIAELCDRKGGSACRLRDDIVQIERPVDPRLQDTERLFEALCSQGSVEHACVADARLLEQGRGTAYGSYASRNAWGYACDGGVSHACDELTSAYRGGLAVPIESDCLDARSGAGGDPRACTEEHTMRTFGVGLPTDVDRAALLKGMACDLGDPRPCVWLGNEAWGADDKLGAFEWYRRACDAGDGISCGVIGRMMIKGEAGVPQDGSGGIQRLRQGCDDLAGNACFELGFSYSQARVVDQDSGRAAELYARSCSVGYVNGCSSLGVLYMDGRGVTRNASHSKWLLRLGCDRGFGSACNNLGNGYRDALFDGAVHTELARAAYTQGCDAGKEEACGSLAELGDGPLADLEPGTRPGTGLYASPSYVPPSDPSPSGPSRPGGAGPPSPPSFPGYDRDPQGRAYGSLGTQRSWTASVQASSILGGFLVELGPLLLGFEGYWNTDARWRPKVARSYQRLGMHALVGLTLPITDHASLDLGGGGGLGMLRLGPGKTQEPVFSAGPLEFIQFNVFPENAMFAIRIEQRQGFQQEVGMDVDHATSIFVLVGGRFEN